MKNISSTVKLTFSAILLAAALSACGGSGGPALAQPAPSNPASFTELSPQFMALVESRYGSSPDLKRAAEGYGKNLLQYWGAAQATGMYNEALSLRRANAQSCLASRLERLGQKLSQKDIADILSALTTTPNLFNAYNAADNLASGHPNEIFANEKQACPAAGIE